MRTDASCSTVALYEALVDDPIRYRHFAPLQTPMAPKYSAKKIWTDDNNIYYSDNETQLVFNRETLTWEEKTWREDGSGILIYPLDGACVWADRSGDLTFLYTGLVKYPDGYTAYETRCLIDDSWESTGVGTTAFPCDGSKIWTDGDRIYYTGIVANENGEVSTEPGSYRLDGGEWVPVEWGTDTSGNQVAPLDGACVWGDFYGGSNVMYTGLVKYPDGYTAYETRYYDGSAWEDVGFAGTIFPCDGSKIWTDGETYYYSGTVIDENGEMYTDPFYHNYFFNTENGSWERKQWDGYPPRDGSCIWTDGTNIFYSDGVDGYVMLPEGAKLYLRNYGAWVELCSLC